MTILELAGESGVDIPTLCHDAHLTPIGACRLCLVEDESTGRLMASCVTPVAAGMVINTHSLRVIEHRKTIIKLMLASHPDSCLICDKGNQCKLRQIASDLGIGLLDFERISIIGTIDEVNPFIERDLSKCILCAKCIRACQELVIEGAIDYFQRGFTTLPATMGGLPLENSICTFCGTCVALCPTGALMEKDRKYTGTTKTTIETTCPFCGCGCSVCIEVKNNQILRVRPGKADEVNRGALCVRGSYGYDFVHSPDRLTKPLIKVDGNFEEVSWDQALDCISDEFKKMKVENGPNSMAVFGSSKCTNEENYLLQRFTRCILGTNNIDNGSRLYNGTSQNDTNHNNDISNTTNYTDTLEQSEVIIVIGANLTSSAPVVGYAIKRAVKNKGAKLIVIDPRRTNLSSFAHLWLRPRAGTDVALLNSLAKVIIDEGLSNEGVTTYDTDTFKAFSKTLQKCSPEYAEAITGVASEEIRTAAQLYATANQASIIYGSGVTQHAHGAKSVKALTNLAILTGNPKNPGKGIYALQQENNGQGACDMGALPDFLPGYESVVDPQSRKKFEKQWKASLPAESGLTALEVMEQVKEGKIKGMWIMGENPVLSFPHGDFVAEALDSLNFLVVQDIFLTETAKLATVVLPATSFAEKDGTFTNFEGRISRVQKAIEPVGESLPDWEIVLRLADKMNHHLPFSSLQQVIDEMEEIAPKYHAYADSARRYQAGLPPLETSHSNKVQSSKENARFSPVDHTKQEVEVNGDYPFNLLTGTTLYHFGSGTRSSRAWRLKKYSPEPFVEIGESDAKELKITQGDTVKITSPAGEVTTTTRITDTLPDRTIFMPVTPAEAPVNNLFDIVLDPEAKTPSFKSQKVRIERVKLNG